MIKLQSVKAYLLQIPFSFSIDHNLKQRLSSESIIIEITDSSGRKGYGEGAPRAYVTGESGTAIIKSLPEIWQTIKISQFTSLNDVNEFQQKIAQLQFSSLTCAFEMALLDLLGQNLSSSITEFLKKESNKPVVYSVVIPYLATSKLTEILRMVKKLKINQLKLKVGVANDLENLQLARDILGDEVDIRVDGNRAWELNEAIQKINSFKKFRVSCVEEPLVNHQVDQLPELSRHIHLPLMLDETLCSLQDAKKQAKLIDAEKLLFNLKLSKVGGLLNASKIHAFARERGIKCQLGCHVGESAILSAAGRIFAQTHSLEYLEGAAGPFFMEDDVATQPIKFEQGGRAVRLTKNGLGITVNADKISKYSSLTEEIRI